MQTSFVKRKQKISDELELMYEQLHQLLPGLSRIAVALYEKESGVLHSFLKSPATSKVLTHYGQPLEAVPSLLALSQSGRERVIHQMRSSEVHSLHALSLIDSGLQSSYTVPLFLGDELLGFVFFDSQDAAYFSEAVNAKLSVHIRLLEALIVMDVLPVRTLMGMVSTARRLTGFKDNETGKHIARVSAYAELIAASLAEPLNLSDEFVEYLWLYAPLHDIGKISIADGVLLKPDKLSIEEFELMKTHVDRGSEIIRQIIEDFNIHTLHHIDVLMNIIAHHHERWDGKGYPQGLAGEDISIEGRILAVADVFDALSTSRVYRPAYAVSEAFDYIERNRGKHFDPMCVEAFLSKRDDVLKIHERFKHRVI